MDQIWARLRARLPSQNQVFLVFSVIVFVVFSWTLIREFFQVPSWLKYMVLGDILVLTAYILAFALFESLLVLGFLLLLSIVFPVKIFRDKFIAQGCSLVIVAGLGAVLLQENISLVYHLKIRELIVYPLIILLGLVILVFALAFVFDRLSVFQRLIEAIADRMTVFSYLYLPLGLIALVIVILRNLW
jgi:hypothetical protein